MPATTPTAGGLRAPLRPPLRRHRGRLRRRPVLWWAATAGLTVLTGSVVAGALAQVAADADRFGTLRPVLVATAPVTAGEVVDEANTEVRELPAASVAPGAVGAEARGARATHPLHAGEVVHEARLAPAGLSPVAALLTEGTRGVSVPAGADGIPLQVGDVVDVLATVDAVDGGGAPTVTVAAGAQVVHVGEAAVTVAVATADAPKVAYAVGAGLVALVLVAG